MYNMYGKYEESFLIPVKEEHEMSTTQKRSSVGCLRLSISLFFGCLLFLGLLFTTLLFIFSLIGAVQAALLPQRGIQTQATVVAVASATCGKHNVMGFTYTVQFTDQVGHLQTGTLTCASIATQSRGDSITIVYSPDNPTLIALPNEVGFSIIGGVGAAILIGLLELALLLCCIFWVRHEKNIVSPLLPGRKRADSRQGREAEQANVARPAASIYVKDEKWTLERKQEPPASPLAPEAKAVQPSQASQLELFEPQTQNEQEAEPSE
jgi:Protein of unknown function (DUF3592)